jgi:hypothetical protein
LNESTSALRQCPTRIDGQPVLFAHKVNLGQCQDRQRGHYHKCFTCVFNNALAGQPRFSEDDAHLSGENPKLRRLRVS